MSTINATVLRVTASPSSNETESSASYQDDCAEAAVNSELNCRVFTFVVYVVIFGIICTFGVVGNGLSFVVLNLDRRTHTATFLLQVMALTDSLFLVTAGFAHIFAASILFVDRTDHPFMPYMMKYIYPLVHITQLGTVWITVFVAFNRFVAICWPFRAAFLCTMNRVRAQVGILAAGVVLYNIPRFAEYRIESVWDSCVNASTTRGVETDLKLSETYNVVYETTFYCIVVFLGPLVALVFLNARLIRELVQAHRRLNANRLPRTSNTGGNGGGGVMVEANDQDHNITLVMVVVVIVFLVCQTPAYVNQVLYYVLGETAYHCGEPYFYYYHLSNLVVSSNSAVNFFIYCAFRRKFRQRLYLLCRRGRAAVSARWSVGRPSVGSYPGGGGGDGSGARRPGDGGDGEIILYQRVVDARLPNGSTQI